MEGVWRTLAAPIIASIIGGLVVGIVIGRVNAPKGPSIVATSQTIDFSNPWYSMDRDSLEETKRLLTGLTGTKNADNFLEANRFNPLVRVVRLELRNTSNLRSKSIEISGDGDSGFILTNADIAVDSLATKIAVPFLDPNSSVTIIGLFGMTTTFFASPILILHGDEKIDIVSETLPSELAGLVTFLQSYPTWSIILAAAMIISTIFIGVGLIVAIASYYSPEIRLKLTSKGDLRGMIEFIEYVREKHPKKFTEAAVKVDHQS